MWNSHLSAWTKSPFRSESWVPPEHGPCVWHIARVDKNVIQVDDDCDINHICKNVIHKSLKGCGCIGKPFRHYQPLERAVSSSECRFPFISGCNSDQVVRMSEIDLGLNSCFQGASRRSEMSGMDIVFLEIRLSPLKLTQSRSEPSFLQIKRTGPHGWAWGWINPVDRFLLMNLCRAQVLLGQGVDRTKGQSSAFIQIDLEIIWLVFGNFPALDLLNTSVKLWYSSGTLSCQQFFP